MSALQNSGPSFEIMIKVRYYIHKFGFSVDIEMVDIMDNMDIFLNNTLISFMYL